MKAMICWREKRKKFIRSKKNKDTLCYRLKNSPTKTRRTTNLILSYKKLNKKSSFLKYHKAKFEKLRFWKTKFYKSFTEQTDNSIILSSLVALLMKPTLQCHLKIISFSIRPIKDRFQAKKFLIRNKKTILKILKSWTNYHHQT